MCIQKFGMYLFKQRKKKNTNHHIMKKKIFFFLDIKQNKIKWETIACLLDK